jgi:peptidoglycan hydrolase-like protein with peptidoglycan-binding domain
MRGLLAKKNKTTISFIQKVRAVLILLVFLFSFFPWTGTRTQIAKATTGASYTFDSQADWQQGTADANTEINQMPGDVKLKMNKNEYAETTKADFDKGHSPAKDAIITQIADGEVIINQGYTYTTSATPAIGNNRVEYSFLDTSLDSITHIAHNLLYIGTWGGGLSVINTQGTVDLADDTLVATYTTDSSPAIGSNDVYHSFLDTSHNLLYVSTDGGLSVINTQGTVDSSDDTLVINYNESSLPPIQGHDVFFSELNDGLLYISLYDPLKLAVIDTKKTVSSNDDVVLGSYSYSTNLASRAQSTFFDTNHNLLYISTCAGERGGLQVVDTKGTATLADDETIVTYNSSTNPPIGNDCAYSSFLDPNTNLLYVNSGTWNYLGRGVGGVSVIDTKGTISPDDDVLVAYYNEDSSPPIANNDAYKFSFLDFAKHLLYISTAGGLSVINTQGTVDPADDTLVKTYATSTTPSIGDNHARSSFLDSAHNLLYVSTYGGGLSVINLNDEYNSQGEFISQPLEVTNTPTSAISFSPTLPAGTSASIQTRTGNRDAPWIDNFDDNSTSEYAGDHYEWGCPFDNAVESNGTMKLSGISSPCGDASDWWTNEWIDTGKPDGYFPAGSTVTVRMKVNSNAREYAYNDAIFDDEWTDGASDWKNNEWMTLSFTATVPFSKVGFETDWLGNTWNNANDSLEIDYIKIEFPIDWNEWSSECTNQYCCPVADTTGKPYLQYKLNLTTSNADVTPSVNSVTLASGYNSSGVYTSPVIDATRGSDWQTLATEQTTPAGTSITYQTRSGNAPTPDDTWSGWEDATDLTINSPESRYLQIRATLATTDENETPVLSSLAINYDTLATHEVTDPTPEKMADEVSQGFIDIQGDDPTQVDSFTFKVDFTLTSGDTTVTFPADTVVTKTGGGTIDLTAFTTEDNTLELKNGNGDILGSVKLGIPSLNLNFSQPVTISIPVDSKYNGNTLNVIFQRENETKWNDETECDVENSLCTFTTTHATTFAAQEIPENAKITSWKAEPYQDNTQCQQKLKLTLKGKHFDKDAEVRIGNKEATSVNVKSSQELTAKFCLAKLLNVKTDLERSVSVTNPDADRKKAKKEIDLGSLNLKMGVDNLNPQTTEGIKNIQIKLVNLGLLGSRYITGCYGSITTEAVRKFQEQNGLPTTGLFGPLTREKIKE